MVDQRRRANAVKRGSGKKVLSLNIVAAESQYAIEPAHNLSPEKLFEKSELPKIQGRRVESIKFLELLGNEIPESKAYCDDIRILIRDYDAINEGSLKDIAQLDARDLKQAYKESQSQQEQMVEAVKGEIEYYENIKDKAFDEQECGNVSLGSLISDCTGKIKLYKDLLIKLKSIKEGM